MKILVYGAGAVGSVFGGFLSQKNEVTLLGRPAHLNAIRKKGLKISGIWGKFHFKKLKTVTRFQNLKKERFDLVLVTVKAYDTAEAARDLKLILGKKTTIISLQNGLGNIEKLSAKIPKKNILAGRVIFGAAVTSPGNVKITVMAEPTAIGEAFQTKVTKRVKAVVRNCSECRIPVVTAPDVRKFLWRKVIYNCSLNPLASLLNTHYGALGEQEETRIVMDEVMDEIYEVAKKSKMKMDPPNAALYRKLFYSKLLPRTFHHRPSMLQDFENGRSTEIDALNGAISKLGKKNKVKAPVNDLLTKLIKAKEKASR